MNKLFSVLAAAVLALAPGIFNCCQSVEGGTEIPNELRGRELIAGTGKPAADAEVRLIPVGYLPGEDSSAALFTARTDADGRFAFQDLPAGQYNILAAKDDLLSYRDSVPVTGKSQSLAVDSLQAPGSLSGTVKLQPQHFPQTATVQVLGTTLFVNVGADGRFMLPGLGAGEYRLRVVTIEPGYSPLFRVVTVRAGSADTLSEPLELFYARTPVVTGLRADAGPDGTLVLRWNRSAYRHVQAYVVYRDSMGAFLPSSTPMGRTEDTVFIDTIYSRTPRATQFPYLDSAEHPFRYRVRILDQGDSLGPIFGSVEGRALPPSRKFSSGLWKTATTGAAFSKRSSAKAVAFAGKMWLFGGYNSTSLKDLWSTSDGVDWRESTANLPWNDSAYVDFYPFVFRERMWMMSVRFSIVTGFVNVLWKSEDGSAWQQVTDSADFPGRQKTTVAVFQDKLWVLDGVRDFGVLNDIRTSLDGVTWTRFDVGREYKAIPRALADTLGGYLWKLGGGSVENGGAKSEIWRFGGTAQLISDSALFANRIEHGLVSYENKLWLIAGYSSAGGYNNDVWSSEDGETWVLRDAHAPFSERGGHACAIFQGRLWVIGGTLKSGSLTNDVWYMESP